MRWESDRSANVSEQEMSPDVAEIERAPVTWIPTEGITAEAREDADEFEDFDEEDFDDEFDDDFEEEQDEEYEAENEEYPDDDFGTGVEVEEDLDEIEIEGDIEGDFDDAAPGAEPAVDEEEGEADVVDGD